MLHADNAKLARTTERCSFHWSRKGSSLAGKSFFFGVFACLNCRPRCRGDAALPPENASLSSVALSGRAHGPEKASPNCPSFWCA